MGNNQNKKSIRTKVKAIKFDNHIPAIKPDFIKIDAEGSELMVFKGASETIRKYKPLIMCELSRKWCVKFSYHPNEIIKFLAGLGYKCYDVYGRQVRRITDNTLETNFIFKRG